MTHLRAYTPDDREFILSLAPRLTATMPAWRDPELRLKAVEGWITGAIAQVGQNGMIFVAENDRAERLGFVTVSTIVNFLGLPEAYVGELASTAEAEGQGAGKALLQGCEDWAWEQGCSIISLDIGAENPHALGFYHHLGYTDEVVKLIKLL